MAGVDVILGLRIGVLKIYFQFLNKLSHSAQREIVESLDVMKEQYFRFDQISNLDQSMIIALSFCKSKSQTDFGGFLIFRGAFYDDRIKEVDKIALL